MNTNSGVTIESATSTDQGTVVTEQMGWPYPFQQYSDEDPFSNKHEVDLLPDVTVIEHRVETVLELDPEWGGHEQIYEELDNDMAENVQEHVESEHGDVFDFG